MATVQRRKKREMFFDADGNPLANGYLKYYKAGTTDSLTTYSDADGLVPNTTTNLDDHPELGALIQLDSSGFTTEPVYFGPGFDAKEALYSSTLSLLSTEDDILGGVADAVATTFANPEMPWSSISVSTVLTTDDYGKSFAVTPGSSTLTITLPDATNNNGKSILFQKIGTAGTMRFITTLGQTINAVSSYDVTTDKAIVEIISDGANHKREDRPSNIDISQFTSTFIDDLTEATTIAEGDEFWLQLASAGAFRKVQGKNLLAPGALIAIIEDQQTSGTAGQSLAVNTDNTRRLTTLVYNRDTTVSLSSNQFTLPAGTWEIAWISPVNNASGSDPIGASQSSLFNVTDSTRVASGTPVPGIPASDTYVLYSFGSALLTLSASKTLAIRHKTANASAITTGGAAAAVGLTEVYTRVVIRRG